MFILEKTVCPQCSGSGTIRLKDREFAICGACGGKGFIQKYQKMTASQIFGMIWQEDNTGEVRYAVNSGISGIDTRKSSIGLPPSPFSEEGEVE